jgi:trimeric autotransporter adhesin
VNADIAYLYGSTFGTTIALGGADGANTVGLTDTELDGISANALRIGDPSSGTISFVSQIAPAGVNQLELHSGLADIQDNHAGTDVTVARLTMNAFTGIGVAGTSGGIDTDVALIEAETAFGGMNISNVGAVSVGGVTDNLLGLWVSQSGDLSLTAGGAIDLADRNGAAVLHGGTVSGNVFLTASGAAADITRADFAPAIMAQGGSITVTAGRDIVLATGSFHPDTDVLANDSVTLSAGRDIVLGGSADIVSDAFDHDTGGDVTAIAGRNISLSGFATIAADGDAGGNVTVTTGADGRLTVGSLGLAGRTVYSNSGDLTINADRLAISNSSDIAAAHSVTLQSASSAWAINLGSFTDTAAGTLELSDTELDRISTPTLRIGSTAMTGDLTVSSQITAQNYDTLSLRTGGGIVDGIAGQANNITVDNLALHAASGIGHSDYINLAVSNLAFDNSGTRDVNLTNASGLTLAAVDGLAASSNAGGFAQVIAHGALTVATNVTTSGGLINLIAEEASGPSDNVTVLAGTTVQSPNGAIQLGAGDDVVVQAGSILQAELVIAAVDAGSTDAGVGGTVNFNGTVMAASETSISGRDDNDILNGTPLDDTFDGSGGADVMRGGAGNDSYYVDTGGDTVTENAGEGTDRVLAFTHFVLPDNVENLTLMGVGNWQGYGNDLANTITGNEGSNLLDGRGGADAMAGGFGNDVYIVDNAGDTVTENAGQGTDLVFSTAHFALSANVESLILQGNADLQGYGNTLANTLYGNAGNNLLDGRGGADIMRGGAGNDTYFVDDAGDQVIEGAGQGNDAVFSTAHFALSANVETLVLQGGADLHGYGNTLANLLYGNAGANLLDGRGGADVMTGGAGNDTYFVDDAGDMVIENPNEGTDAVFATVDHTLAANVETLVLQGSGNLSGTGNALANSIYGNAGNNTLNGGGAADLLTGNDGNDTFVFNGGQGNGDSVVDFAGNGAAAGDALQFVGYGAGATFTNVDATHWQVNYNGGTAHDVITFMNGATIDASDFMFV